MTDWPVDDAVRTVALPVRAEVDKIKGSRFICDLGPADSAPAARSFVDRIRVSEPDATHYCWAYRLSTGSSRSSDDGEPGGTAGPPILRRLEVAGLSDVVAVVTRYYGGTNLGTGGLIRAYGSAAAAAIDTARIRTHPRLIRFRFTHPYEQSSGVAAVLAAEHADIVSSEYGADVTLVVRVPQTLAEGFVTSITDETSGLVVPERVD